MGMKKLKKASLAFIAQHLTKAEVGVLGDIFHDLDSHKSGFITLHELDDALKNGMFILPFIIKLEVEYIISKCKCR